LKICLVVFEVGLEPTPALMDDIAVTDKQKGLMNGEGEIWIKNIQFVS